MTDVEKNKSIKKTKRKWDVVFLQSRNFAAPLQKIVGANIVRPLVTDFYKINNFAGGKEK